MAYIFMDSRNVEWGDRSQQVDDGTTYKQTKTCTLSPENFMT
jgi:hypothetical protein